MIAGIRTTGWRADQAAAPRKRSPTWWNSARAASCLRGVTLTGKGRAVHPGLAQTGDADRRRIANVLRSRGDRRGARDRHALPNVAAPCTSGRRVAPSAPRHGCSPAAPSPMHRVSRRGDGRSRPNSRVPRNGPATPPERTRQWVVAVDRCQCRYAHRRSGIGRRRCRQRMMEKTAQPLRRQLPKCSVNYSCASPCRSRFANRRCADEQVNAPGAPCRPQNCKPEKAFVSRYAGRNTIVAVPPTPTFAASHRRGCRQAGLQKKATACRGFFTAGSADQRYRSAPRTITT